jgi:hypothetical protein
MPRQRLYATNADRQRAYRRRKRAEAAQALQAVPQRLPPAHTTPVQPSAPPRDITKAMQDYHNAMLAYRIVARRIWPLRPPQPSLKVLHWWRQVEMTKQRWMSLMQTPPGLTARR